MNYAWNKENDTERDVVATLCEMQKRSLLVAFGGDLRCGDPGGTKLEFRAYLSAVDTLVESPDYHEWLFRFLMLGARGFTQHVLAVGGMNYSHTPLENQMAQAENYTGGDLGLYTMEQLIGRVFVNCERAGLLIVEAGEPTAEVPHGMKLMTRGWCPDNPDDRLALALLTSAISLLITVDGQSAG